MEFLLEKSTKEGALQIGNKYDKGKPFVASATFCMKSGMGDVMERLLRNSPEGQIIRIDFLKQCQCGEYV